MDNPRWNSVRENLNLVGVVIAIAIPTYLQFANPPQPAIVFGIIVASIITVFVLKKIVENHFIEAILRRLGWIKKYWQIIVGLSVLVFMCYVVYSNTRSLITTILILLQASALILLTVNYFREPVVNKGKSVVRTLVASEKGIGHFSTSESFDDMTSSVECEPKSRFWVDIPGSKWIWIKTKPDPQDVLQNHVVWHRHNFTITREVAKSLKQGDIIFAVDNAVDIWINLKHIGHFDGHSEAKSINITNWLQIGKNDLKMKIVNWGSESSTPENNPAGIIYRVDVRYQGKA